MFSWILPNQHSPITEQQLYDAARYGSVSVVKEYIRQNSYSFSLALDILNEALLCAAAGNYPEVVRILLEAGANIDHRDIDGETPLMYAVLNGSLGMVQALINHKANIRLTNMKGETALHFAVKEDIHKVRALIDAGADVNDENDDGQTPLFYVFEEEDVPREESTRLEIVNALIQADADVNHEDIDGYTPLMFATFERLSGEVLAARALILHGANVNHRDQFLSTPLIESSVIYTDLLLESIEGDDIDNTNQSGESALSRAAAWGQGEKVIKLLDAGATISDNVQHKNPVIEAARFNHINILDIFLARKISLNFVDQAGNSALMAALKRNHFGAAMWLIHKGANVNVVNNEGKKAKNLTTNPVLISILEEAESLTNQYTVFKSKRDASHPAEAEKIIFAEIVEGIQFIQDNLGTLSDVSALSQMIFDFSNLLAVLSVGCNKINQNTFDVAAFQLKKVAAMLHSEESKRVASTFRCESEENIRAAGLALPFFPKRSRDEMSSLETQDSSDDEIDLPAKRRRCG
ncbi:MAG: ankyrin repeat domain-containing protein [Gammaproteobacteria bacterium]|nr:ankyrin repeat domain-containing protein [Gammaproteobacteria bacterium]